MYKKWGVRNMKKKFLGLAFSLMLVGGVACSNDSDALVEKEDEDALSEGVEQDKDGEQTKQMAMKMM